MNSKSKRGWVVLGTCFLMLSGAFSPLNAVGGGTGNFPAPSGTDWTISNDTHVWNETIILDGNLIVTSGGNLTLENVTILFNCSSNGQYRLEVMDGGQLHISDENGTPSVIASNTENAYKFWIQDGATADISGTVITGCGYSSWNGGTNNNTGLWINSANVTISDCNISGNYIGIYIHDTTSVGISSCLISSNTYGIYINDSKDLVIMGNVIQECSGSGIYVDSTGYNTIQHENLIFCDDFNDGDLSDWNISTTGNGVLELSNAHYVSADKSLYMHAPGNSKAFARSPKFSFDDDQPYNLSTYFYLPHGNNHWLYIIASGHVRCVIDYGGDVKTCYDGSSHLVKTLGSGAWYSLRFEAHPSNSTYDVYINGNYCQTAEFDESDSWDEIQMGDDTEDGSNYGSMYWDDLKLGNITTSTVYYSYNIDISNNQIDDCGIGVYSHKAVFVNMSSNQITDCTYGIKAKEATPLTNSNTITNSTTGIIIEDGFLYEGEVTGERECVVDTEGTVSIEVPGGAEIIDASFDITGGSLEKEKVINHTTFNDSEVSEKQSINTSDGEIKLMDSDTWTQTTYADFNMASVLSNVDINSTQGDITLSTSEQLDQSNSYSPNAYNALWNNQYIGQSFVPSSTGWCTQVEMMIYKIGNPAVNLELRIYATSNGLPTGAALASKTVTPGDVGSTSGIWRTFTFSSPATLSSGTTYAVCAWSTSTNINNAYGWEASVSNTGYAAGTLVYSTNQGGSWSNAGYDNPFKTYVKYYCSSGYLISTVFDSYGNSDWGTVSWSSNVPSGTSLVIKSRSGGTSAPDGTWSNWASETNGQSTGDPSSRYLQYKVELTPSGGTSTSSLQSISVQFAPGGGMLQSIGTSDEFNITAVNITGDYTTGDGTLTLYVRNGPGNSWHQLNFSERYNFSDVGKILAYKVEISKNVSSLFIYQLNITYYIQSRLTNVSLKIGQDEIKDWNSTGEFYNLTSKLSNHAIVTKMNDALKEQYIQSVNYITLNFGSLTAGEIQITSISMTYYILSLRGDTIENVTDSGVELKNSKASIAVLSFDGVSDPKVNMNNSNITSIGCNLLPNDVSVDSSSIIYFINYLEIQLQNRDGLSIYGGYLLLQENDGLVVFNRTLNSGYALIQARYATKDSMGTTIYTPHNITAQKYNITKYDSEILNQNRNIIFTMPRLDLTVINLTNSDDYPLINETLTINTTIYNDGYENCTSAFTVSFYINDTIDEILIENRTVNTLNAWSEINLQNINFTFSDIGYKILCVRIDNEKNVTEDDNMNNLIFHKILVCDEKKDDWIVETETEYDGKVIMAERCFVSSELIINNGILELATGNLEISSNGVLQANKTTIAGNNILNYGEVDLTAIYLNITGDLQINDGAEMYIDNSTIKMNNEWIGQHNISLNQTSNLTINNTLIHSGIEETYFDFLIKGNARITNTTVTEMNHGLIIETNLIYIDNVRIQHCNEYGMQIISSNISIHNTTIGYNKFYDARIVNSSLIFSDCEINYSNMKIDNGSYIAKSMMTIHVINETDCNISGAQVLIKNLDQELIFDGRTNSDGFVTFFDTIIQTGNSSGQQKITYIKTPLTVIVTKGNISNVTKTRNLYNNNITHDFLVMLRDDNEWNHISIRHLSMKIPNGIIGAFSCGEAQAGMTFCAHVYNNDTGPIIFQLNSTNITTNENDLNDIFYDVKIYNESGIHVGYQNWSGYGSVYIQSVIVPNGHYDIIWKYYNNGDGSELNIDCSLNKFIFLSVDARLINTESLEFPKSCSYSMNLSYIWDNPRDIYLHGYTHSVINDCNDSSHISNLFALNNTYINTNTINGNPLYANSIFGYYLGNNSSSHNVRYDLVISSNNNGFDYSQDTFLVRLNYDGWKNPDYNDLDHDGLSDSSENGQTQEGDAGGRADLNLQYPYVYMNDAEYSHKYQGWQEGKSAQYGSTIYWSQGYCTIRRDIALYIWLPNSKDYSKVKIGFSKEFSSYDWLGWREKAKTTGKEADSCTLTLSIDSDAPIMFFTISYYSSMGVKSGIVQTVYVILDLEILNYLDSEWGNYKTNLPKYALKSYMYDQWSATPYPFSKTIIYSNYQTSYPNRHYEKEYLLNPINKDVYQNAVKICYGATDIDTAILRIGKFTENIIYYTGNPHFSGEYKLQELCTQWITDSRITEIMDNGKELQLINGQCLDYASMVCGFARAVGIPARDVYGVYCHNWNYHVWTEYWSGNSWVVYDACDVDLTHTYTTIPIKDLEWDTTSGAVAIGKSTRQNYKFGYDVPINSYDSEGIFIGSPNWNSDDNYIIGTNDEKYNEQISPSTYDIINIMVEYN